MLDQKESGEQLQLPHHNRRFHWPRRNLLLLDGQPRAALAGTTANTSANPVANTNADPVANGSGPTADDRRSWRWLRPRNVAGCEERPGLH
jgi:hypothetical protein